MKALSLTEPWGTLIKSGAKRIETRSWSTNYRGWIAIHTAKKFPGWVRELCITEPFASALRKAGHRFMSDDEFAFGAVIAVAYLHRVGRIHRRSDGGVYVEGMDLPITGDELEYGDYAAGRWAWVLTNVHPLATPIPAKGQLGLWEWQVPAGVLPEGVRL